uniref:cAMP-regulated phosphoprotein 19 n=1 Tax=Plectus sambesii TaxID=2011161 RepID=A0A914V1Y3_9BILA
AVSPEKQEEMKLMNKLASKGGLPAKGPSSFLQKRLQQRKFFDSGDYAMDKAKNKGVKGPGALARGPPPAPSAAAAATIAAAAAAPDTPAAAVLNVVVTGAAPDSPTMPTPPSTVDQSSAAESASPTGLEIPRPETVPQRKSSIIYPSAHSKLSPQPHLHHPLEPLSAEMQEPA